MWFVLALVALLCWSGSDLFSKIGCREPDDKLAHLKMVMAVGLVMGLHAAYEIFIGHVEISWQIILTYLPVSLLYILSMGIGYFGLRYIELSVSSPICNSSGALVAILTIITAGRNRRYGESRLDMISDNITTMRDVVDSIRPHYTHGVILVVSNPVDILTYKCAEWMDLPNGRVLGTGCILERWAWALYPG